MVVGQYISHLEDMIASEDEFLTDLMSLKARGVPVMGDQFTYDVLISQSELRLSSYRRMIDLFRHRWDGLRGGYQSRAD